MATAVEALSSATVFSLNNDSLSLPTYLPPTKRRKTQSFVVLSGDIGNSIGVLHKSLSGISASGMESPRAYNMRLVSGVSLKAQTGASAILVSDDEDVRRTYSLRQNSFHVVPINCTESPRAQNIRLVSGASIKPFCGHTATGITDDDDEQLNFDPLFSVLVDNRTGEKLDTSFSSAASLSCIQESICILFTSIGANEENAKLVADECFRLAIWTRPQRSSDGYQCLERSQRLNRLDIALIIVSFNGLDALLTAMEQYPNNVQIQEYCCMAVGNILSILYPRRTTHSASLHQAMSKGDKIYACIINAMKIHSQHVSVCCAAVPALHYYYSSIFFNPLYSNVSEEAESEIFAGVHDMFLPTHIRNFFE